MKGSNKEFCDGNAVCERQGPKILIKKDYVGAIDGMTKVLRMDDSYSYAVFYMGQAISCWAIPVMRPAIINV